MLEVSNMVFLGCNYNDKKIKAQFDNIKKRLEADSALACIIVDKRTGQAAKDLWKDIRSLIEQSAACVFDLTGFRPNVVLELGYALSIKAEGQVYVTFRKRKSKGKTPQWLLSDIGHLNRHEYVRVPELESHIRKQLEQTPYGLGYSNFVDKCQETNAPDKYEKKGLEILQLVRDNGSLSDDQVKHVMTGTACRFARMTKMLKSEGLITRGKGPYGKYTVPVSST